MEDLSGCLSLHDYTPSSKTMSPMHDHSFDMLRFHGCRWTLKPEFGEVPQYLIKNKKQIADEKANVEEHIRLRQQQVITSCPLSLMHTVSATAEVSMHVMAAMWSNLTMSVNTAFTRQPTCF